VLREWRLWMTPLLPSLVILDIAIVNEHALHMGKCLKRSLAGVDQHNVGLVHADFEGAVLVLRVKCVGGADIGLADSTNLDYFQEIRVLRRFLLIDGAVEVERKVGPLMQIRGHYFSGGCWCWEWAEGEMRIGRLPSIEQG